jgi:hypothetical protein
MAGFGIRGSCFVLSGTNDQERQIAEQAIRAQIAFYASTPAYRPVLELHGWGSMQEELNELAKAGRWDAMGSVIDAGMLSAFAIVADTAEDVADALDARFGDVVDGISLYAPYRADPRSWRSLAEAVNRHR